MESERYTNMTPEISGDEVSGDSGRNYGAGDSGRNYDGLNLRVFNFDNGSVVRYSPVRDLSGGTYSVKKLGTGDYSGKEMRRDTPMFSAKYAVFK